VSGLQRVMLSNPVLLVGEATDPCVFASRNWWRVTPHVLYASYIGQSASELPMRIWLSMTTANECKMCEHVEQPSAGKEPAAEPSLQIREFYPDVPIAGSHDTCL
jgi:hypothetical protein